MFLSAQSQNLLTPTIVFAQTSRHLLSIVGTLDGGADDTQPASSRCDAVPSIDGHTDYIFENAVLKKKKKQQQKETPVCACAYLAEDKRPQVWNRQAESR